jgi:large subunit ribosomal protein L41
MFPKTLSFLRETVIFRGPCLTWTASQFFSTSNAVYSRKNPRKYPKTIEDVPEHLQAMFKDKLEYEYPDGLQGYGVQLTGIKLASTGKFVVIPEMVPELVVPDLTDFPLKAYVSFKVPDIKEPKVTARDLFDVIYGKKIKDAFEAGKLDVEVKEVEERERLGKLKTHTYDREPPRMLDSSQVPVV